jgi:hypothetical protein
MNQSDLGRRSRVRQPQTFFLHVRPGGVEERYAERPVGVPTIPILDDGELQHVWSNRLDARVPGSDWRLVTPHVEEGFGYEWVRESFNFGKN